MKSWPSRRQATTGLVTSSLLNGAWDEGLTGLRTIEPARLDDLDRYGLHHLTAHLDASECHGDLHRLLRLESRQEQAERDENVWFVTHDRVDDLDGYISDVSRAWRVAERAYQRRPSAQELGLQCRYALITASVNSLAEKLPLELIVSLVKVGSWSASKGLTYAQRTPDPRQRARVLADLALS